MVATLVHNYTVVVDYIIALVTSDGGFWFVQQSLKLQVKFELSIRPCNYNSAMSSLGLRVGCFPALINITCVVVCSVCCVCMCVRTCVSHLFNFNRMRSESKPTITYFKPEYICREI